MRPPFLGSLPFAGHRPTKLVTPSPVIDINKLYSSYSYEWYTIRACYDWSPLAIHHHLVDLIDAAVLSVQ